MSNNYGISEKSFDLLLKTIAGFKDIDRAVIFGSRAKGNYKKGSDIDMAIYGETLQKETILSLYAELNENTPIPYFVDVIAPQFLDKQNLIDIVEQTGIVFFEKKEELQPE